MVLSSVLLFLITSHVFTDELVLHSVSFVGMVTEKRHVEKKVKRSCLMTRQGLK